MNPIPKILIVDDNPTNLELLRGQLRPLNAEILSAQNGHDALEILETKDISLAILDVQLPGMHGFEIAEHIRNKQSEISVQVILITAVYNDARNLLKGYQSGAVDYIIKPVTKNVLLSKVKVFLGIAQKERIINDHNLKLEQELIIRNRKLHESEKSFKAIFNNTLAGFYRTDMSGDILMLNPAANNILGLTGYDSVHNINLNINIFKTETSQNMFKLELAMKGEIKGLETIWKRLDGNSIHVSEYARVTVDENENPLYIEGIFNDITLQVQNSHLLSLQKNMGYELLNIISPREAAQIVVSNLAKVDGIDVAGFYLFDSKELKLMLEYSVGLSDQFGAFVAEYNQSTDQFKQMDEGRIVHIFVDDLRDERSKPLKSEGLKDLLSIPFKWENQLLGVINLASKNLDQIPEISVKTILATIPSINEALHRIQFYKLQQDSHRNLLDLFDSIEDYIFVMDRQGKILQVNNSVVSVLGYSRKTLIGQPVLMVHPPELRDSAASIIARMINHGEKICNIPIMDAHGKHIPVETRVNEGSWNGEPMLIGISRDITARIEQEKLLKFRLDFESMMAKTGMKFVNINYHETDQTINETLKEIGKFLNVDRSYVFLFNDDFTEMDNTHEWCNQGIEPQIDNLKNLPVSLFPWWMEILRNNRIINYFDIDEMPAGAENEKNILKEQDIKSIIIVPLFFKAQLLGFAGFDSVQSKMNFSDDTEKMLTMAAGYFANAIEHKRKSLALDDYRKNLEIKVAQRTNDLKETNLKLKSEIQVRKEVERELRKLSVAIEQSATAVIITNIVGNIEYINPATTEITGYKAYDLIGKRFWLLNGGAQDEETHTYFWNKILSGKSWIGELNDVKADQTPIKVNLSITPIKNSKGVITSFIALYEDITKQKQMESMVIHSQKMEAIGSLASGIAHDFNNLLQVIKVFSDMIKLESSNNESIIKNTIQIDSAVERGNKTIKALLNYSRNKEPLRGIINLSKVMSNFIQVIKSILPETISISSDIERNLFVKGDSVQLEQVVMNLAMNAKDAMNNKGNLKIGLKSIRKSTQFPGLPKTKYALLTIEDDGKGIDEKILPRIFDPFFTTKKTGQGTGLGLSVVAGIIEGHHGFIETKSQSGTGSQFGIYLPLTNKEDKL